MKAKSLLVISIIALVILSGCTGGGTTTNSATTPTKTPAKTVTKNATNVTKDFTPPSSISNLQSHTGINWVNWTWDNPGDQDFSYANIYINGKFKVNVTAPKNYYNLTGLPASTQYTISIRTVDKSKNVNLEWVNSSTLTKNKPPPFKDTTPPGKIMNLKAATDRTWINWTWDNPSDDDFSYTNIYINGIFKVNLTKPKNYYNISKLAMNTTETISTRTVDKNKTINMKWVNNTATTVLDLTPPNVVTNLAPVIGRTWINWTWDNPMDADFNYAMVYLNGKFKVNTPKGFYNSTGLKNSTNYTISLLTADTSKNINPAWVNSTAITQD